MIQYITYQLSNLLWQAICLKFSRVQDNILVGLVVAVNDQFPLVVADQGVDAISNLDITNFPVD